VNFPSYLAKLIEMVHYCSAFGCQNSSSWNAVSFFRFPNDPVFFSVDVSLLDAFY